MICLDSRRRWFVLAAVALVLPLFAAAQESAGKEEGLKRLLQRYPEADQDRDGILTLEEARRFRAKVWQEQTDAGEPIVPDTPEAKAASPVTEFGEPSFPNVSYGDLPGQYFSIWLPRDAVPPCPAVICLTLEQDNPLPPAPFMKSCLNAGIAVCVVRGRQDGNGELYFEDVSGALNFLAQNAVAHGVKADAMALFGTSAVTEQTLFGSLIFIDKERDSLGVRCAVILDAQPRTEAAEPPAADNYLEIAYPKAYGVLAAPHNTPSVTLLHKERHGGDLLHNALRAADLDALMYNAAEGEEEIHLLRMATLFIMEKLGATARTESNPTETAKE